MVAVPSSTTITIGSVTFNSVDANDVSWIINSDGLDGWSGSPAVTLAPSQKPRSNGTWAGDSFLTGRTIAIRGRIFAPTAVALNQAIDQLNAAITLATTTMTVNEAGYTRFLQVRRSDEVLAPKVTQLAALFSVQLFAQDPRKTGTPLVGTTLLPSTSGGLVVPFTVPFSINSSVVAGTIALTNPGNIAGLAVFRLDGPAGGPVITHRGVAGTSLVFSSSLVLNSGEWLTVNNDAKTALANDQSSRNSYITSRGWSAFDPGLNTWSFTASSYNALSKLTVTATPSWL